MSMVAFESASALLREHEDRCDFVGPRDEPLILAAEEALGLGLPPSYRAFVARFGAGDVDSSAPGDDLEQVAPDFGTWLLELCRDRLTR